MILLKIILVLPHERTKIGDFPRRMSYQEMFSPQVDFSGMAHPGKIHKNPPPFFFGDIFFPRKTLWA